MHALSYSVYPGKEIDNILSKLYEEFSKFTEKEDALLSENIGGRLKSTEKLILKDNLDQIPLVRINDYKLQKYFNKYLDRLLASLNDSNTVIDYFSAGLSQEIGNNNLDIQENKQSAALLHSL